ncbi:unnamed protein product [Ectocarpus sp. 12 AP-2014]
MPKACSCTCLSSRSSSSLSRASLRVGRPALDLVLGTLSLWVSWRPSQRLREAREREGEERWTEELELQAMGPKSCSGRLPLANRGCGKRSGSSMPT